MKILVTYFSQTGNTEQIAKAINEEVSTSNDVSLSKIEDVDLASLNDYNLVFIGTPIHAGGISTVVKEFLETLPSSVKFKLAGFITHSAFAYEKDNFEKGLESLEKISSEKGITYAGTFNCQGRLTTTLHDMVKKSRNFSDEDWADRIAKSEQHPNKEDESNAKEFARKVIEQF